MGPGNRKSLLIFASLAVVIVPYSGSSFTVVLPAIGDEFQLDTVIRDWTPLVYSISAAFITIPFGRSCDIFNRNKY